MNKSKTLFYWILGFIFVLGFSLRTLAFYYRDSFEDDECRLILAFMNKTWMQMFFSLGDAQSAPPVFVIIGRILGTVSGFSEKVVKSIPYLCSLISLFVFYRLGEKFFVKNYSKLLACFLFAVNIKLITFSSLFKQYSTDVLICMLCLLFMPEIDLGKLNRCKLFMLGIILAVLPFVSLPSLFFIIAFFAVNIKNYKKVLYLFIPFLLTAVIYYFINLLPSKLLVNEIFSNYWDAGFIDWKNGFSVLDMNFKYFFYPNVGTVFEIILLFCGFYFMAKETTKFSRLILIFSGLVILASFLHLYPFAQRVALYSIPVIILLIIKPLDVFKLKSIIFGFLCICLIAGFGGYGFSYFKSLFEEQTFINYSPKAFMKVLKEEFNPETDVVLCNNASSSSFLFYSSKMGFHTNEIYEIPVYGDAGDYAVKEFLDSLDNSKRYWFYLIKDYPEMPRFPAILAWSEKEDIIVKNNNRKSYLLLVRRKYN